MLMLMYLPIAIPISMGSSATEMVIVAPNSKSCPANEEYSQCGANICQNTCDNPSTSIMCRGVCTAGCVCKEGYLRNKNNICVLPKDCESCGGDPNAVFVPCGDPCPKTCENKDKVLVCPAICKIGGGCKCRQGYVRNNEGKCIKESDCPVKCPANQTWYPCPLPCPPEHTCDTFLSGIAFSCRAPPDDDKRVCQPICKCSPGFIRSKTGGKCIKPNDCCNDPNAEVVSCPNPCPGGTCESPEFAPCKRACKLKGCQCKKGYVKDSNGKCILLSSCPKKCGANEVWNPCVGYCTFDMTCERLIDGVIPDCARPPPDWECYGDCRCIDGFVRIDGKCVEQSACCPKPNTELVNCPNPCPGGTCESPSFLPCDETCKDWGCQCKKGFVLNNKTECIPQEKCLSCGANEHFACGPRIEKNCTILELDSDTYGDCVERCYCNEGYVRNSQNVCIPISDCNKTSCGINEVWNPCPGNCEFENTCEIVLDEIYPDCAPPTPGWKCVGRCECAKGLVRINGTCEELSVCCSKRNAEFVKCPDPCPEKCVGRDLTRCERPCRAEGCQCRDGNVIDSNGKCIPSNECPQCGENEVLECGPACDTTCATLGQSCPIYLPNCKEMCYCQNGYARDSNNTCVPLSKCPPKQCPQNEIWNPCPRYCSFDKTCEEYMYGWIRDCTTHAPNWRCSSIARCECLPGYVRINRTCVLPNECCSDPNAEFVKCPNPCPGGTCDQPGYQLCRTTCRPYGCQCKKGFLKDITGTCIPAAKCPNSCGKNEVWNPCPPYCSFDKSCEEYFKDIIKPCTTPSPNWSCYNNARCECLPGHVRINGQCELANQCCTDPNSELVKCPNPCPGGTCDQPEFQTCALKCANWGCQCKKGFLKGKDGICIPLSECPKISVASKEKLEHSLAKRSLAGKCGNNEVWDPCEEYCSYDQDCERLMYGLHIDCFDRPIGWECSGRCKCLPGLVRIGDKCVERSNCCSDPNSEFVKCPKICQGGTCDQPMLVNCDGGCYKRYGCQCKPGYLKDDKEKCIPENQCPKRCGPNEKWNPCPGYCTFDQTCKILMDGIFPVCDSPPVGWNCTGRCECAKGFVRINEACEDPSKCCTDPNSELVQCPNPCPGGTCEQPDFQQCNIKCANWGCQCKKGFVKDINRKCIELSACTKKCGNNEVWDPCEEYCGYDQDCERLMYGLHLDCFDRPIGWECSGRCKCLPGLVRIDGKCLERSYCCTDPNAELVSCPNPCPGGTCDQPDFTPCKIACKSKGCQCKSGYVKDSKGVCIPLSKCPKKCGKNEFFDCGSACDRECATLGMPCNIINKKCVERCYCNRGFARNKTNVCIPVKDCPPLFKCGLNEEYVACPSPCPPEKSCSSYFSGIEPLCPIQLNPENCKPVCRCKSGYLRDVKKKCVLPAACCTDPSSILVDNPNCCPGGTCAQPSFLPCKMKCPRRGCVCKPGFLKKSSTDPKCIAKNSCPVTKPPTIPTKKSI